MAWDVLSRDVLSYIRPVLQEGTEKVACLLLRMLHII